MSLSCASCQSALAAEARFCPSCGTPAPVSAPAAPKDPVREVLKVALGRQYEIQHLLGKGGMGAVYLATEAALEREVAIKVLPPDRGATKDSRDRFRREARTAAKLSHPNIVPLYTFGDVDGTLYFVMGYVKGESLAARLKREGRLQIEDARRILIEIAEALDYAHKLGVIHRDIKPDNVLIEEGTGRALLTDFGVAKAIGAGQTMTEVGSVLGTPHYMSPEQAQGKADIDHRSDLYSLGVMGYAMFAGRLPFEGSTPGEVMVQHISREAPALTSLAPETPSDVAGALTRALVKNPGDRWPDARGFRVAISGSSDTAPVPARLVPVWRLTQALAVGGYLTALIWANAAMTPPSSDPLASQLAIDTLPRGALLLLVICLISAVAAALEARKSGHSLTDALRAARVKPDWWIGWYPAGWRARGDVWDRLPGDLRRARSVMWWSMILLGIWFPFFLLVSTNANNFYRFTGQETALVRLDRVLKTKLGRGAMAPPIALVALGLFLTVRWKRRSTGLGARESVAEEAFTKDTADRSFWSQPEVAALLVVHPRTSRKPPDSAREIGAGISQALAGAGSQVGDLGRARMAARQLTEMVVALDNQISALAGASDAAEVKRLTERLAALGPDLGPTDLSREVREILRGQLDAARNIESRVEAAKSRRSLCLDLLQSLWVQATDLRDTSREPLRSSNTADRLGTLLARIDAQLGGAMTLDPTRSGAAEAISDAPTIERS